MMPDSSSDELSGKGYWDRLDPSYKVWIALTPFLAIWLLGGFLPLVSSTSSWRRILEQVLLCDILSIATLLVVAQLGLKQRSLRSMVLSPRLAFRVVFVDCAVASALLFLAAAGLVHIAHVFLWPFDQLISDLYRINPLGRPYPEKAVWLVETILLGPIYEEMIFRGVMRELFRQRTEKKMGVAGDKVYEWRYIFFSSLLFGTSHWAQGPTAILTTFFAGMLACHLYIRLGYLLPIIIAHGLINAVSIGTS